MAVPNPNDTGEYIPGMAKRVRDHARSYGTRSNLDCSSDQINEATWEQVYECSPISDLIDHKPDYADARAMWSLHTELDRRLDTKAMNEWARNLSDLLTNKGKKDKAVPFWRR